MIITSIDNEIVKHIKKLKEKKYREEYNEFIVEGIKMINEAIEENAVIKQIIISESFNENEENQKMKEKNCIFMSDKLFGSITDVVNPQGIMAIIEKPVNSENTIDFNANNILILDNIQDPGNMGTILRTADSLNLKQIIVSKGSSDIYNLKVVRSTMGAIFRVKVIESENLVETIKEMKKHNIKIYATDLSTDKSIYDVNYEKSAIVIGNESNGVSKEVLEEATERIKIPMIGKTESLNAAIATSIIMYEVYRSQNKLK